MAHFLIYLPNAKGQSAKLLEDAGLADLVARAEFMESQGPDGGRGVLVAWRRPGVGDKRFHFAEKEQTWLPAVPVLAQAGDPTGDVELPARRYWVGVWKDSLPKPTDLARDYPYRGASIELGDGNSWLFPEARELPRDLILSDDGTCRYEVQRRFHAFWLESFDWVRKLSDGGDRPQISYGQCFRFLTRSLRLNYRLAPELVSLLKLFNTENLKTPLLTVIGVASELRGSGH
jgi:hypothetical protein